jgi:alkanesulfonate monooxygenase SsuD/methylene tetrahydromethanopterin reductase-like flavin-dependent oxidoreductase (luciferase family)
MFNLTAFICDIQGRADWGVGVTPPPPEAKSQERCIISPEGPPNAGTAERVRYLGIL